MAAQTRTGNCGDFRRRIGALRQQIRGLSLTIVIASGLGLGLGLGPGLGLGEARADWREAIKGLRIGVVGVENPEAAARRIKPFADFLESDLEIGVETVVLRSYNAVIEAQADGRIDIAAHSASTFVAARAHCGCVEAVAVPLAADGATHFYGIAMTRKTDNVEGLADLNGRTVALGEPHDTAAYRVPAASLALEGETISSFFAEARAFNNHVGAMQALMQRRVDAVFTWSSMIGDLSAGYSRGPLRRAVKQGRIKMSQIDIIWKSQPIPHGPVTVRADLPEDLKGELRRRVLNLYDTSADAYFALEPWFGFGFEKPDMAVFEQFSVLLGYSEPEKLHSGADSSGQIEPGTAQTGATTDLRKSADPNALRP